MSDPGPLDAIALAGLPMPVPPLPWFLGPPQGDRAALLAASIATPGIARQMDPPAKPAPIEGEGDAIIEPLTLDPPPAGPQGGGNLNGTAATILDGQAGTSGQRIAVPRAGAGNFCGVV